MAETRANDERWRWATARDQEAALVFDARRSDWRCGPIVYQVLVDRFAPSARLEEKRGLYAPPRRLRSWDEQPVRGRRVEGISHAEHELQFWGGDLASVRERVGYLRGLGVDVLYLNPIHLAQSNHKYDAQDFHQISPEYGTREDVCALAESLHAEGMRLMLDGVFNHMGKTSPRFQEAIADVGSRSRDWYSIDEAQEHGFRGWHDSRNLPELNLENPEVLEHLWRGDDSVVRRWLRDGVDGWRLDVAYDLGFELLADLTRSARRERADAWVVGELWNYPDGWIGAVDGVMNFFVRQLIFGLVRGQIRGGQAGRMFERVVEDTGLDGLLRSWLILDNHDTGRLASVFPDPAERALAQTLQFTLPGAPVVYYGVEAGMRGSADPACRGPMEWDRAVAGEAEFDRLRALVQLREALPALRCGGYRALDTDRLVAFQRTGARFDETVTVVVNPSRGSVSETIALRDAKLMNYAPLRDALGGGEVRVESGTLVLRVPAKTARVYVATDADAGRYSPYKRIY